MKKDDHKNKNASPDETSVSHDRNANVPKERHDFRSLIVANPNYYGNLKLSQFQPVLSIQSNTTYEEIGCVGFQPQSNRLDAVVFVKQPFGYGGDVCSTGTQEYIRFYLSFDDGVTWVDQGMTSFTAYDITGTTEERRVEYAVSIPCHPPKTFCVFPNVILARAILSWNDPPPANVPDHIPVWGEVHNTHLQVDPLIWFKIFDLFDKFKIPITPEFAQVLDVNQTVSGIKARPVGLPELHALYQNSGVEPHRYAMTHVQQLIKTPALTESFKSAAFPGAFAGLKLNIDEIIGALLSPDGNTSYEELECVGYNAAGSELIATLRLKRPSGYSGGPCTDGSREYVTFWADFDNNGVFESCLGTASVQVFDTASFPDDGLEYSVFLPVNFNRYRQPCDQGPRLVPIRAILSWNDTPPCADPDHVPFWGNREETLIHIYPGDPVIPGDFRPILFDVSLQPVCNINQNTGLATGDRPFGRNLYITGDIPAALDVAPDRIKYRVFVRELPSLSWQPLGNDFPVTMDEAVGGVVSSFSFTQSVDAGYYTFREYHIDGGNWRRVSSPNRLLAKWPTVTGMTGMWEIRIEALDSLTSITYVAQVKTCLSDGTTRQNVKVWLDQERPVPELAITDFSTDGGVTWNPALNCGTFEKGMWIRGTYSALDEHFGSLTLTVEPQSAANGAAVNPSSRVYGPPDFVPTAGENGTWTLDTSPMDPCGFVIRLDVYDRTIVDNGGGPWHDSETVGFCLKAPGA